MGFETFSKISNSLVYLIMKQSLWDLKLISFFAASTSVFDYEAIPMGFETVLQFPSVELWINYEAIPMGFETCYFLLISACHAHYEAIPMGFETFSYDFFYAIVHSL